MSIEYGVADSKTNWVTFTMSNWYSLSSTCNINKNHIIRILTIDKHHYADTKSFFYNEKKKEIFLTVNCAQKTKEKEKTSKSIWDEVATTYEQWICLIDTT